jgi:hypothetical protein
MEDVVMTEVVYPTMMIPAVSRPFRCALVGRYLGRCLGPCLGLVLGLAGAPALAAPAPDESVDIGSVKDKLRIFTDGKKHYFALVPFDYSGPFFFYGDGETFWTQRSFGGGRSGDESFNRSFWDPRSANPGQSMFQYREKKYSLDCAGRETTFTPLPEAESAAMVASGKFMRPRWKRQSYWLARDDKARYYYVDRAREPEGNKNFRLFVGPKGNLKQQRMTNAVSDSRGDIFSTKSGELRLITSGSEGTWIQGKTKTTLTIVPIEENHVLVYGDLGVYTGEKLGTPCDDL